MELEHFGRPTCNKICAYSNDGSTVVCVVKKLSHRRVLLTDRFAVAKLSKSRVWDKVPEGSTLVLEISEFL